MSAHITFEGRYMQLVYPKGDYDLRKYSYLFDDAANTDFTTVPQLIEVLRNVRATPKSISGTNVVLHEMSGIVNNPAGTTQRLYLTRVGFVGGIPDFSTPTKFLQTFAPTVLGTGQRTDNLNNIDPPVRDGSSGQIVFPMLSATQFQGITCLYPTKVGSQSIGTMTYTFTPMSSFIQRGFGGQSGGSVTQRRANFGTSATTNQYNTTLMSYDSSESGFGKGLNMNQAQAAGLTGFSWAYNSVDGNRAGAPARQNSTDPNVPYVEAAMTKDAATIQLTKGLVVYWSPDTVFCIKLGSSDFSFPATAPGEVASGTMAELPKPIQQRVFDL